MISERWRMSLYTIVINILERRIHIIKWDLYINNKILYNEFSSFIRYPSVILCGIAELYGSKNKPLIGGASPVLSYKLWNENAIWEFKPSLLSSMGGGTGTVPPIDRSK